MKKILILTILLMGIYASADVEKLENNIKACNEGNSTKCYEVGSDYYTGKDVVESGPKAVEFYSKACDLGNPHGCYWAGVVYDYGSKNLKHDRNIAENFYIRAEKPYIELCDNDDDMACSNLALMYALGYGVKKDSVKASFFDEKAFSLWVKTCHKRDAKGCRLLGNAYEHAIGIGKDEFNLIRV